MNGENIVKGDDSRIMTLLGQKYYRSDLAAEILKMHKNTLLRKAKQGKIKKFRHKHSIWFRESWIMAYLEKEAA